MFPGYVFCRFDVLRRLPILTTPGVLQILGTGNTPIAVSEMEIASLQAIVAARIPAQPFPFVQVGQRVRINQGVLAGVEGIVISFKQCLRLVLSVALLQRSILLEIDQEIVSAEQIPDPYYRGVARQLFEAAISFFDGRARILPRRLNVNIHFPPVSQTPDPEYRPTQPTPAGADSGGDDWSGIECLRALYRRKSTILWITCLGAASAALITAAAPRWYQSQASIEIQGANENFLNLRDVYPTAAGADSSPVYIQTQADLLQQDDSIEQVVRKLRLQEREEFQAGPSLRDRFRRMTGTVSPSEPSVRTAVEMVRKHIRVVPSRNTRIIHIVCDARNAPLAADIANTLAENFVEQSIKIRQQAARQTYESLSLQLAELRSKLPRPNTELTRDGRVKGAMDAGHEFYDAMLQKADEARIASALRQSNIRLAGLAQPGARPYKPNLPLNLAIGIFGGLVVAIGLVMLQEQTNSVLRVPGEAGTYLTLPELGAIPKALSPRLSTLYLPGWGNGKLLVERAALEDRSSSLSEAFRTTLASILSVGCEGDHPRASSSLAHGRWKEKQRS